MVIRPISIEDRGEPLFFSFYGEVSIYFMKVGGIHFYSFHLMYMPLYQAFRRNLSLCYSLGEYFILIDVRSLEVSMVKYDVDSLFCLLYLHVRNNFNLKPEIDHFL